MLWIYTALLGLGAAQETDISPWIGHTSKGDAEGKWVQCKKSWVRGLRVKIEGFDDVGPMHNYKFEEWCKRPNCADQTALNAINVLCSNEDPRDVEANMDDADRTSMPGLDGLGKWSPWLLCDKDEFVTGVRVWSEKDRGAGISLETKRDWMVLGKEKNQLDDTGMNNVALKCTHTITGKSVWKLPDARPPVNNRRQCNSNCLTYPDGSKGHADGFMGWSDEPINWSCKPGNAMSGFKVRTESNQGGGNNDDSAMNQLKVECTKLPKCTHVELSNVQGNTKIKRNNSGDPEKKNGKIIVLKDKTKDVDAIFFNGNTKQTVDGWTVQKTRTNCDGNLPQSSSISTTAGKTEKVWDWVSYSESLAKTFTTEMSESVSVSSKAGISLAVSDSYNVGASRKVVGSHTNTRQFESTAKSTSTRMTQTRDATGIEVGYRWTKDVPAYSSMLMQAEFYKYDGKMKYTATATCYNSGDKANRIKLEETIVEGHWETQGFTKGQLVTKDITKEKCPAPECKCEAVYSKTLKDGSVCQHSGDGETSKRWAKNVKEDTDFFKKDAEVKGWCYVRKGACNKDMSGRLNTKTDDGLDDKEYKDNEPLPGHFEWSSEPCLYSDPKDWNSGGKRRLDFEETGGLNPEFVGPALSDDDGLPAPMAEETRRRAAQPTPQPTPAPTTYLQKIPGSWPKYAMEECSCDTPNRGVGRQHNQITCLYSDQECAADEICFVSGKTVWARTQENKVDNWRTLCKKA